MTTPRVGSIGRDAGSWPSAIDPSCSGLQRLLEFVDIVGDVVRPVPDCFHFVGGFLSKVPHRICLNGAVGGGAGIRDSSRSTRPRCRPWWTARSRTN